MPIIYVGIVLANRRKNTASPKPIAQGVGINVRRKMSIDARTSPVKKVTLMPRPRRISQSMTSCVA